MGIETALLAMGASAGTAASVAGVAGTIGTGLSVLQGVSSLIGGAQAQSEAKNQASIALAEATKSGVEQERQAWSVARQEGQVAKDTERRQKLAYLSSGVSLAGSPLLVMEKTRQQGIANVNEILKSGNSASQAAMAEGRITAAKTKSYGRTAFMEGLSGGLNALKGIK